LGRCGLGPGAPARRSTTSRPTRTSMPGRSGSRASRATAKGGTDRDGPMTRGSPSAFNRLVGRGGGAKASTVGRSERAGREPHRFGGKIPLEWPATSLKYGGPADPGRPCRWTAPRADRPCARPRPTFISYGGLDWARRRRPNGVDQRGSFMGGRSAAGPGGCSGCSEARKTWGRRSSPRSKTGPDRTANSPSASIAADTRPARTGRRSWPFADPLHQGAGGSQALDAASPKNRCEQVDLAPEA